MTDEARWLKLPGQVFRTIHNRATYLAADDYGDKADWDLVDAVSRARIRHHGAGFQAFLHLNREQAGRLADWIDPKAPKVARDYAAALREYAEHGAPPGV